MKKTLLLGVILITSLFVFAQQEDLYVKAGSKGRYVEHKTGAKQNFYSVGRLYNISPRTIAAFNGLDMGKGLSLGQVLKIPLTDTNFTLSGNQGVPVYYLRGEEESLATISRNNNDVPVGSLRHWNNIQQDSKPARKLIVGFLVSKEMQERVVVIPEKREQPNDIARNNEKPQEKQAETKKLLPETTREQKNLEPIQVKNSGERTNGPGGYFRSHFDRQVKQDPITKEETVTSGIFKTTSGWQDGKYYLLIDKVEPGTIVKITNPANNRVVYAKVLYGMEGIRQNQGLDIRMSNAAASALEITETDKFIVKVNY